MSQHTATEEVPSPRIKGVKKQSKVNPVYKFLRDHVHITANELRQEWSQDGAVKDKLASRNKGVRCFMKLGDIFPDDGKKLQDAIHNFQVPESVTQVHFSDLTAVETACELCLEENHLVALYAPSSTPVKTIYGGLPCELTDLAIRSTFLRQLKSPSLHLSESDKLCELYVKTSFYVPQVEVRKAGYTQDFADLEQSDRKDLNVVLMSQVESVLNHLEENSDQEVKLSKLIYFRLLVPFMMALRQNQNRQKLNESRKDSGAPILNPIRHIVIGDMGLRCKESGVNTLYAQRLKSIIEQFDGCFDSVTICGPDTLRMHVELFFKNSDNKN